MCSKFEERNNEIIQELKDLGYANRKINYEEFLRIYEPYKEEMSEKEFAVIIGISKDSFGNIKYQKRNAIILKDKEIEDKLISEIRKELIKQGYSNRKIDYEEFLRIYEPYRKQISEINFTKVLELSYGNYRSLKNQNTKAVILKDKEKEDQLISKIREELIKQGYSNRKIDYEEFLRIYEPYKKQICERNFAKALGMLNGNYIHLKYQKAKAIILKDKGKEEQLISEIREELIRKGYSNRKINYEEFLRIYEPYRKQISESKFAKVLKLSYSNYRNLKNKKRVIILKDNKLEEKLKNEIREELIRKGYSNRKIDYEEFLRIYEPYKKQISERNFAKVLGLSDSNYNHIKNQNTKAIILKENKLEEKLIAKISEELIRKGYSNRKIDYEEFLRIYEPYRKQISEWNFSKVLGLSESNYRNLKYQKAKVIILKDNKLEEKLRNEIREELIRKGYLNRKINYEEFLRIYEPYRKQISEINFAKVLELSYGNYRNLKNQDTKAIILKDKGKEDQLISKIREELIRKGYSNRKIDYEEFLRIYEPYRKQISENNFAKVLELSYSNYSSFKSQKNKVIILKDNKLKENLKNEIREELIKQGYSNRKIDYEEFLRIYEPYKEKISEINFARALGMSDSNYRSLKYQKNKAVILKDKKLEEELINEIRDKLTKNGYSNRKINYEVFLRIYEPYSKQISERKFAKILGLQDINFKDFKNGKLERINFNYLRDNRIKHLFRKSKKYKKEYFEKISKDFEISIEEILEIVGRKDYINALDVKGYVFLGKKRLSQDFIDRNIERVSKEIHRYSKFIGRKLHTSSYAEDIAQETLLKIIEERGDLEENYSLEKALEKVQAYAFTIIKYKHLGLLRVNREISLDENLSDRDKRTRYSRVKAKENVEEETEKREEQIEIAKGDTAVITIQKCLENGMDRDNALKFVMEKYKLSKEELLEILKKELLKRKELKTAEDGRVYLVEKSNKEADGELDY